MNLLKDSNFKMQQDLKPGIETKVIDGPGWGCNLLFELISNVIIAELVLCSIFHSSYQPFKSTDHYVVKF
jgi:hypothetical protein